ncbi:hypothetical protein ACTXT7_015071 [Hymenolepis weldensis]
MLQVLAAIQSLSKNTPSEWEELTTGLSQHSVECATLDLAGVHAKYSIFITSIKQSEDNELLFIRKAPVQQLRYELALTGADGFSSASIRPMIFER